MNVIIRELAYADLERIRDWISKDNPRSAASVIDRILDAIEQKLAFFPYIGHSGRMADTCEWVVHGLPYIIVYQVDDTLDEMTILAVFHGAQDRQSSFSANPAASPIVGLRVRNLSASLPLLSHVAPRNPWPSRANASGCSSPVWST